tara:strand:+ start:305 stop:547 length:243 start_codon:yes stop_codon:yes gene_type:complete
MQYFLMMPGDSESESMYDSNLLGESSFKVFWAGQGLKTLMKMVEEKPELLEHITIRTDQNNTISVTEFLDEIKSYQVRIN